MAVKFAINGFGRIGRLVARLTSKHPELELATINHGSTSDPEILTHLFKYDSVHGTFKGNVSHTKNEIVIEGRPAPITAISEPAKLPWKELGVDIVVESTGRFRTYEKAHGHIEAGAKKVVVTAAPKGKKPFRVIVIGVNHESYDPNTDHIVSNASCTTNCIVPVAKVLHDNFRIMQGYMTTIHSYTNDQRILDRTHKDLRRARAAAMSMIPTTTGAAKMIGLIFPELKGKTDGMSIRVPTPDVSIVDFSCTVEKETTAEQVNQAFKAASEGPLKGIIEYMTEPLVSCDLVGNPYSAIFDSALTQVIGGKLVKVYAWYDNEYGYSCRVVDLLSLIAKSL
ncbi:type I glyceraldehyde-3-phosphate dehydrogenase [candidate division WOR-3 bacterium JGI_Cruoil_03_51_56]|uniref:Glyceraldehyde-3-phosphate dehydrogenase n=1 Tax=candidate division WOR-3 bacterium JGI_Cruoil_03_51_56 TaxID=1973747 RepID=A0A235BWT7_UNCW3|nr:MAG: type I glyceraldehyde-3-phosphate dehydrogenase [candidate division WOR-3 bacterium JGI_Cruoil_03_51_56]